MDGVGNAVVRFRSPAGDQVVGHGVLVDDEHVATCAHVINSALGRPATSADTAVGQLVRLEFPQLAQLTAVPPERRARVDAWAPPGTAFDGIDVAGLTIVGESRPAGVVPMPLARVPRSSGCVLLYGPALDRPGGWASARLKPRVSEHRQQLEQDTDSVFVARPGFSGTPVIDEETGEVLGILVATALGRGDVDVYSIPLSSLKVAWPEALAPVPPSPFKGLNAFSLHDSGDFFGRERLVDELERACLGSRLVPLVGASGVGKSSVVYAGLLPRLAARPERWRTVTVRPHPTLLMALAAGFARAAGSDVPIPPRDLEDWHRRIGDSGLEGAAQWLLASADAERVLLVIDQFEEVLQESPAVLAPLLSQLAHEPGGRSPLVVVLTLREDAFGAFFVRHAQFGELLRAQAVAVRGMTASKLGEVIRKPAAQHGVRFPEPLVAELVRQVEDRPGALPLLEFCLEQMWRTLRPGQRELSFDAYQEIGRLDGALARHADGVLAAMGDADRAAVPRLFVHHLISPGERDVRRVATRTEIPVADWPVVLQLVNERLLTLARNQAGEETVEVVHEALLRAWRRLSDWLDAEQPFITWRQLLRYAMQPSAAGDESFITGSLLGASERWLADPTRQLTLEERRFIEASRARRDEEEQRYELLYRRSLARTLTAAAERVQDPMVALRLAVEALARSPEESARLVRACLRRVNAAEVEPFSPGPTEEADLARATARVGVHRWALGTGTAVEWVLSRQEPVPAEVSAGDGSDCSNLPGGATCAYSAGTGLLGVATEDGEITVARLGDRTVIIGRRRLGVPVTCLAISPAGDIVAAGCEDDTVRVLRVSADLEPVADLAWSGFHEDVDISADGRLVAALTLDGRVGVWDLVSEELVCDAATGDSGSSVVLTGDGDYVLVAGGRVPVSTTALASFARAVAERDLTPDEWHTLVGLDPDLDDKPVRPRAEAP